MYINIVYIAVAVSLGLHPVLKAFAFNVVVWVNSIAPEYGVEVEVGSSPFVVYLMVTELVEQEMVIERGLVL